MGNFDLSNVLLSGEKPSNVNSRKPSSAAPVSINTSVGVSKVTVLKYSIATLLLCVSSFAVGWCFPYVIIAISGSGVIAAVPLAIFAVSTVVALISTIYLIRLAVSRSGNEKKIDLSGEESGHIASQEPQKSACENSTNLENKPSVPTPQQSPLTLGTAIPQNNPPPPPLPSCVVPPPPPPPPEGLKNWNPPKNNPTGEKSSVGAIQKNTSPRKKYEPPEDSRKVSISDDTIINVRANLKKPVEPNSVALAMLDQLNTMNLHVYSENECSSQDDEGWSKSEHSGSDISCANEGKQKKKKLTKHREKSTSSNLQSEHEKRSKSPDSGHGSDTTSPSHSVPKGEKPLILPEPAKQKESKAPPAAQVNNVELVNSGVKDPSISSIKDRRNFFDSIGGVPNPLK